MQSGKLLANSWVVQQKHQSLVGCLVPNAANELKQQWQKKRRKKKKKKKTMKRGMMSSILFPILFAFAFLSSPVFSASDLILAKVDRRVSLLTFCFPFSF